MSVSLKNTLGLTLLRYVFGFYFAATVVITSLQISSEYFHEKNNIFQELANFGETIESSIARSIWNYNQEQVKATLLGFNKITLVSGTKITDLEGEVFSFYGDIVDQQDSVYSSKKESDVGLGVVNKIEYDKQGKKATVFEYKFTVKHGVDNEAVGYCYIYANHAAIVGRVQHGITLIVVNALIKTMILWLLFLFFTKKIIAKPLGILSTAIKELDPNNPKDLQNNEDLDNIYCSSRDNELHTLISGFLQMRNVIEKKIDIIEQQNTTLEQRVKERTATIEEVNSELKHLSLHDPLTGLPNRNLFYDRLETLLKTSQRNHSSFIVASIDLCKFKEVNDVFGHQAGDQVLKTLSKRMHDVMRDSDTVARMGGDEFAMLLQDADASAIDVIGKKIISCAYSPVLFENNSILSGINVGFSIYPDHLEVVNEQLAYEHIDYASKLFKNADIAMYEAKQNEKGISLFTPKIKRELKRREIIVRDIEYALDREQLHVYYQPIICSMTHDVKGVEALLRWQHPELGFIPPDEFISVAERSNMIKILTVWVIKQSLKDGVLFQQQGYDFNISINLSPRLISDATFPQTVEQVIGRYDFPREKITLELTESSTMQSPDKVMAVLDRLKILGVKLSIDDFGTGYSSFSYLARLPVDELKIDRSFFVDFNENSQIIVEAMIVLAHRLQLTVVAEGVEQQTILTLIESIGCDYIQGYYFSRPIPYNELLLWLADFKLNSP
ncbi:MAG: bifunctional diguanylate cyclase/phosphodiesterase [Cellvibrionaceae bacterium]|nr:bifunctional diguanylate cyclase/phosphodiesterase [Cellvibrionaceae bacterium]